VVVQRGGRVMRVRARPHGGRPVLSRPPRRLLGFFDQLSGVFSLTGG